MSAFKKTVSVVGIGPRKQGVSKNSGVPYDFCEIAVTVNRKNWEGAFPVRGRIAGERLEELCLVPGDKCTAFMYFENYEPQLLDILDRV